MAIYHFKAKMIKRSEGKSIIAAAAYRRADKLFSAREERSYDYSDKPDVIWSELTIPHDSPEWVKAVKEKHELAPTQTISDFWNLVDANEKRKDSQPAREYLFALPIELTQEQN
ncbi:MAG: MobA/MobL family protein, partial [Legionellales bacterium]|nr:MobA/MobL family protein [Legionellales bacterium]